MRQPSSRDPRQRRRPDQHALTERLDELCLGAFSSVAELREIASNRRGRRIEAVPFPLRGTNISGLLLVTPEADLIVYEQDAPLYHQEHAQLHELSHILLGHVDDQIAGGAWPAQLPQIPGRTITKVLQRTDFGDRIEYEAEAMASLLAMRLRAELEENAPASEELRRIGRSLSLTRRAE